MLGVRVGLEPVLISEYSDTFELLVVEVKIGDKTIRVITGYGPQENWLNKGKTPSFNAFDDEIAAAAMDVNAKLGLQCIHSDPYDQSYK